MIYKARVNERAFFSIPHEQQKKVSLFFLCIMTVDIAAIEEEPPMMTPVVKRLDKKGRLVTKGASNPQKRAGLQMPIGRIRRFLRKGRYASRIGNGAPVYMTAVLEYLV